MPPRKSDASKVATGDEGAGAEKGTAAKKEDGVNIEVTSALIVLTKCY
jgi:hypothetical protein